MTDGVIVRSATPSDHPACENLLRDVFWNLYRPGCHEHYLWHLAMQGHPDVIDELTLVAAVGDEVVGCVMNTRARIETASGDHLGVLAPGPLAVAPASQRRCIGILMMNQTLAKARELGLPAAFLYGDPAYYPRFGFADAETFGITTAEGDNFPDFMGMELREGALAGNAARLVESSLFEFDGAQVDQFDSEFPRREKATGPALF